MLKVMDCKNILKLRSDDGAPEELAVHCKDGSGSRKPRLGENRDVPSASPDLSMRTMWFGGLRPPTSPSILGASEGSCGEYGRRTTARLKG